MVVAAHLEGCAGSPVPWWLTRGALQLGSLGVRIFFVISGFIITTLLLQEHARRGAISLPMFYLRRTYRIFPAYYAFSGVVAVLSWSQVFQVDANDLLHAITYTANYDTDLEWEVAHLWSLSVEEQFYLLWPAALILLGLRGGFQLAGLAVVVCPWVRLCYLLLPNFSAHSFFRFESVCDALAFGCLLAASRDGLWQRPWYRRLMTSRGVALLGVLLLAAMVAGGASLRELKFELSTCGIPTNASLGGTLYLVHQLIGVTVANFCIAGIIDAFVRRSDGIAGRLLNSRPMVQIGLMSYSIYLWQQLFLNRERGSPWAAFPQNLLFAAMAAAASYYLIEKPMLRMRVRIEESLARRGMADAVQI